MALEDGLELLVLLQGGGVGHAAGPDGGGLLRRGRLRPQAQAAAHVGVGLDLAPLHVVARPVGAEHRVRRVVHVPLRVVAQSGDHLIGVVAGGVAAGGAAQPSPATGVGGHLPAIVPQARHRGGAGEHAQRPGGLRRAGLPAHALEVGQGPAHLLRGQLQPEVVPRLQQDALRLHEALAHRPVGGLPEVAPLGVLKVGPPRHQGDAHIGDGGAGEHPQVGLLRQMGEHQPLPVPVQHVLGAGGGQLQAAPPGERLQQQVNLGIVAQGLVVAHALHRGGDGLPVDDAAPGPKVIARPKRWAASAWRISS